MKLKHKIFLEGFLTGDKPFHFAEVTDYGVAKTVEKPKPSIDMKPYDAIGLAMKEEEEAMQMYMALANSSTTPDQKEMFLALANMERSHKSQVRRIVHHNGISGSLVRQNQKLAAVESKKRHSASLSDHLF